MLAGLQSASNALDNTWAAEARLNELMNILQRMRVLSIASANDTSCEEDRASIQIEVDQLTEEITRIADQALESTRDLTHFITQLKRCRRRFGRVPNLIWTCSPERMARSPVLLPSREGSCPAGSS